MKKELIERFEKLDSHIKEELKDIAAILITEHETYEQVVETISGYFESENKIDELLFSEVYKTMLKQKTGY